MHDFDTFEHPLAAPVNRVLLAIESFDGAQGRSAEGAREVRNALQHLLGVRQAESPSGSEEIVPLLKPHVFATGWSSELLGNIHRELQFIVE